MYVKRFFITRSLTATTTPYFPSKGIASHTGRLDVIARMLRASLWTERGNREDAYFVATLEGPPNAPLTLFFEGDSLDCEPRDELSAVKCIRKCMLGELKGCTRDRKSFEDVLRDLEMPIVVLSEKGDDVSKLKIGPAIAFVIGSHHDIELPEGVKPHQAISISNKSYLASHVITFINFYLDVMPSHVVPRKTPA